MKVAASRLELQFIAMGDPPRARITCEAPKICVEHHTMAGALSLAEAALAEAFGGEVEIHIFAGTA